MILHTNIIGEGSPFIILHGFLGMGDNWKTLARKFSEKGFAVHLPDQRNHGRSFHDDAFNYEVMVRDLKNYCDTHNIKSIVLLGHSMGGKVAMLFAARHPEMVTKLIIADISPRYYPTHHEVILEGLRQLDFSTLKSRGAAETSLARFIPDFGTRQFLLKNLYWKDKEQLALRVNLKVLMENIEEVGAALPVQAVYDGETLFLKGEKSDYIKAEDEIIIKNHFKNARIETINKAGHWLHAENPEDFYIAVMNYLQLP